MTRIIRRDNLSCCLPMHPRFVRPAFQLLSLTATLVGALACSDDPNAPDLSIGMAGGTVRDSNRAVLVIPANALAQNTLVTITNSTAGAPLDAARIAGTSYVITPEATTLAVPARLTIGLGSPTSVRDAELVIATAGSGVPIVELPTVIDASARTASADVSRLGVYWVRPAAVRSVMLSVATASILEGATTTLTATPRAGTGVALDRAVSWTTDAQGVARVSPTGVVTGFGPGTARITATSEDASATTVVTVSARRIASIALTPSAPITRRIGESVLYTAIARDQTGLVLSGRTLAWTSSNSAVATVDASGRVTAVGIGSASIVASGDGVSGAASFVVGAIPVGSVTITPDSVDVLAGDVVQFEAVVKDSLGREMPNAVVTYSSSDALRLQVLPGVAAARRVGRALVIVESQGVRDSAVVRITAPTIAKVEIVPAGGVLKVGQTLQLRIVATDAQGRDITVPYDQTITWSSLTPGVAVVSAAGGVSAVAPGTATIGATIGGVQAPSVLVTVTTN